MTKPLPNNFDPLAKETQLGNESAGWDTSSIETANPGDIPIIDLSDYFLNNSASALEKIATEMHDTNADIISTSI